MRRLRWVARGIQLLAVLFVGAALPLTPASADPGLPPCIPEIPIETQAPCNPPAPAPPIEEPPPSEEPPPGEEQPGPPSPPGDPNLPPPPEPPTDSEDNPDSSSGTGSGAGLIGAAGITDARGNPVDRFDVFADPGAWDHLGRKINIWVTNLFFGLAATVVTFLAWLTGFALEWPYLGMLGEQAQGIEDVFRTDIIGGLDLRIFMLILAGGWCMWTFVRGRMSKSLGEGAVSLVISALAVTVLAYPVQIIFGENGLLTQTRDGGLEVSSLALSGGDETSTDPEQVVAPLQQSLVDSMVAQPHQLINFGEPIPPGHPCYRVWEDIVAGGPWADADSDVEDRPREAMREDCGADGERLAAYNENPSGERLLAAFLYLLAVLVLAVPWIMCAFAAGLAPFLLLFEAALFLIAMIVAILPGDTRGFFYKRVGGVIATLAGVVAALLIMTVFVLVIAGTLAADSDLPLIARFLIIDGIAIAGMIFRKRIAARLRAVGQKVTGRLSSGTIGGTSSTGPVPATAASQLGSYGRTVARVGGGLIAGRHLASRDEAERLKLAAVGNAQPTMDGRAGQIAGAPGVTGTPAAPTDRSTRERLIARLDRSLPGRAVHRVAALGTGVTKTALKYSVGAPVYVPRKIAAAGERMAGGNDRVRTWLEEQRAHAGEFSAEYRRNVGRMMPPTVHLAMNEVRAGRTTPAVAPDGARPARPPPDPVGVPAGQPAPDASAARLLGRLNDTR